MAKREDVKKILIIGSGPIIIGQACEFDYSGTQACKALREEGYEVVLANSNPATIMTDKARSFGCKESILQKIDQIMTDMSNRHSKVLFMRYDVRFPQGCAYPDDNELFSQFQESFIKNRKREGYDPAYIAVRECSWEKHQHYHVVLMMNGHKTQSPHDHIQTAERLWEKTLNLSPKCDNTGRATSYGLIDDCMRNRQGQPQENGVMLRKDDPEYERKYDQCFRRCSYLAKVNQKDSSPKHQRELFSSRIQK